MRFLFSLVLLALVSGQASARNLINHGQLIRTVNSANAGWTAGLNQRFVGQTRDDAKRLMGALKTPPELLLPVKQIDAIAALPTDFDSRNNWPQCPSIGEIRDQSDCGSCWAFGAVEAGTDRICISTNGTTIAHLSAQDLNSCCKTCGMGCNGGYPSSAWAYFKNTGIVTGGNYNDFSWCSSYSMANCDHHVSGQYGPCPSSEYPTPTCPTKCDANSTYSLAFAADKHKFTSSYSVSSDQTQIMTEIFNHGPVEGAFDVYDDFLTYKTGVYKHTTGSYLGGHAIKILGWGVMNSANYWLVANSWNEDWGDNGFFKIARGSDECGIESGIVAGLWK